MKLSHITAQWPTYETYTTFNFTVPDNFIRVAICTPTAGSVKASYCTSLLAMSVHFLATPLEDEPELQRAITHDVLIGASISQAREDMVDGAIKAGDVTHVLFIDDDMGFEQDALTLAIERGQPIVIANYRQKTPPWKFTARYQDSGGAWHECKTTKDTSGLEEVGFGGFGFALFEIEVLKALKRPRFLVRFNEEHQRYTTEDVPFFAACREAGYKVWVDHALSKKVYHIGDFSFNWTSSPIRSAPE